MLQARKLINPSLHCRMYNTVYDGITVFQKNKKQQPKSFKYQINYDNTKMQ